MRDKFKRVVCFLFVLIVLAANLPLCACADPISAAAISNAFAQAITAYGASNGVSMTFDGIDSNNTAQIGERMHQLWTAFRSGQQTADDWDTLAAAIFPGLYSKAVTAGGSAVVAVNIAQQYMPDVDDFWNWLLSGPAEMVKVDNAYQWPTDPNTGLIIEPTVYSAEYINNIPVGDMPFSISFSQYYNGSYRFTDTETYTVSGNTDPVYYFWANSSGSTRLFIVSTSPFTAIRHSNYYNQDYNLSSNNYGGWYTSSSINRNFVTSPSTGNEAVLRSPLYFYYPQNINFAYDLIGQYDASTTTFNNADSKVMPYVGDAVARPVPIPDTSDPDYGPLPYIGNLPIPWNDTLFGDGTGTLTDAQSKAVADAIDDSIIGNPDKTLPVEGDKTVDPDKPTTDDPPSNDPDDYSVPGLQNIFPFCIPFDVYNFLSALAAEPTAPHFTATLQFPAAIGGPQTIDIDFNNQTFNTLAQILRTLELLAFIVGLALLTRSMFIRG